MAQSHSLVYENNVLTVRGIAQVTEIGDRQAVFKLEGDVLTVKGSGLNVTKLDKEQGVVVLEVGALSQLSYRRSGMSFKGLFR